MPNIKTIVLFVVLISAYLLIVNVIPMLMGDGGEAIYSNQSEESSSVTKIGVNENVRVTVVRNRIYGKIVEEVGDTESSYLYVGGVPIPLKHGGVNFMYFHVSFIALLVLSHLIFRNRNVKSEVKLSSKPLPDLPADWNI